MKEKELREAIRNLLKEEESIAEKDHKDGEKLRKELEKSYDDLAKIVHKIHKTLSSFGAPGLVNSYMKGLKKGSYQNKFNNAEAKTELGKWYKK